jgi:hypothetical protein
MQSFRENLHMISICLVNIIATIKIAITGTSTTRSRRKSLESGDVAAVKKRFSFLQFSSSL